MSPLEPSSVAESTWGGGFRWPRAFKQDLQRLHPAYFALVMATGIVSLACHLMGMEWVARALFWLNIAMFVLLSALTLVRIAIYPRRIAADLSDYRRGVGFFTMIAACCILGSQFQIIDHARYPAVVLWWIGIGLWIVVTYVLFGGFIVQKAKPSLSDSIHGGWLAAVVATQSISALGGVLADGFGADRNTVLFYCLSMWLVGGMIYIWIIALIFYRFWFFTVSPSDLSAANWINMGAMAISTLAGMILISAGARSPLLNQLLPFLKGFTLFYWATATWWIPILVILGIWRHAEQRFRLAYDPIAWEAVFPIGMYTACTAQLAGSFDLPFLTFIPRWSIYIAIAMWIGTFVGMLYSIATDVIGGASTSSRSNSPAGSQP